MKLIGSISSFEQFNQLIDKLDGIVIGNSNYATYLSFSFSTKDLVELIKRSISLKKEVFLKLDIMPTNKEIKEIIEFVKNLSNFEINYLVQDIGLFQELKEIGIKNIIYIASTMITNYEDLLFYLNNGFKACMPSLEIPFEDIIMMNEKSQKGLFFKVFGYHTMMHSKRRLISTYQKFINSNVKVDNEKTFLIEETRNSKYPIIENNCGTLIFREYPVNYLEKINNLKKFEYSFLDDIFIDKDIYEEVVNNYNLVLKNKINVNDAINQINLKYENTFMDKDTVYLKEEF